MCTILLPHPSFMGRKPSLGPGSEPGGTLQYLPALVPRMQPLNSGPKQVVAGSTKDDSSKTQWLQLHFETFLLDGFESISLCLLALTFSYSSSRKCFAGVEVWHISPLAEISY